MRKHTLEYDDVMNEQRRVIYALRDAVATALREIDAPSDVLERIGVA